MPPRAETVKWLVQNQTSRSRNGAGVVSALSSSALTSARNSARTWDSSGFGLFARSASNAAAAARCWGGRRCRAGSGWRNWSRSHAAGSAGSGSSPRRPRPKRISACAVLRSMAQTLRRHPVSEGDKAVKPTASAVSMHA